MILFGGEKRFDQFAFTAHNHVCKSFKPIPSGDLRLRVQPFNHQGKLHSGNLTLLYPFKQMRIQRPGQVAAQDLWHESFAVEPARQGGLQSADLGRIVGFGQPFG